MEEHLPRKLAVILHADVVGSTTLVQQNETLAHERIQATFHHFSETIKNYGGIAHELRGDAIVAEFERASDAVAAALSYQAANAEFNTILDDDIRPHLRMGISLGEVVVADDTITGTGVVLAQRLEQLAEAGGVCIQGAAYETVPQRLPFEYTSLGEQQVKGFEEPVRAYAVTLKSGEIIPGPEPSAPSFEAHPDRVKNPRIAIGATVLLVITGVIIAWWQPWVTREEPVSIEQMAFALPDKPSLAVLPFTNMSENVEQEYFADGMTDDLITDLSKLSGLFVVSRNSTFTYKGEPVKVRQVAEELGVRYILEGSLRRAADKIRINAQLIDATTGGHLWAERYDGTLDDVFELQDNITQNIVTALALNLTTGEQEQQAQKETDSLEAYDAFLRGWTHYRLLTPDDFTKAIPYLENAIKLDPDFGRAHAALAATYLGIWRDGWTEKTGVSRADAIEKANRHLEEAMKNPTPLAHRIAAKQFQIAERWDEALAESERAIALDPNDPDGYVAMNTLLINLGRPAEALEYIKKAMRLDPQSDYLGWLGDTQFHLERYDEAAATFQRATKRNPEYEWSYLLLAAAYGHLGRVQDAKPALTAFYDLHPQHCEAHTTIDEENPYTLADLSEWALKDEAALERLRQGLRKVGIPEGAAVSPADINYRNLVTMSAGTFDVEGAIEIEAAEAKTLHDRGIIFIDSRGKGLYGRGHIPGAINLYTHQVWEGLSEIVNLNDEVVFYCSGPDCHLSAHSSAQALALGYTKVYYFAGGISAWKNAGYLVEDS